MSEPQPLLDYALADGIATVTMDDGKVNAMSIAMLEALHAALDRAEADGAVLLLTGRVGMFSAGFDLKVFTQGRPQTLRMLRLGATLCERMLSFPAPVVVACTGHAYPMGAFLMLSADRRIGAAGEFRIGLNEVAIGISLPLFAVEVARHRLTPAAFHRTVTGEMWTPEDAIGAGFLDELAAPEQLAARALEVAHSLRALDVASHRTTKERVRSQVLDALRVAIAEELDGD